jgi:hypothetical protein
MDTERLRRLSRQSPAQEADVLAAVEARLRGLFERHGHEEDSALRERFRREHPDLFSGSAADGQRAARKGQD